MPSLKILLFADDSYISIPKVQADIIVSLGDLYPQFLARISQMYLGVPKLAIPGNHDSKNYTCGDWTPLHGKTIDVNGVCYGGFGGCIPYKDCPWVFSQQQAKDVLGNLGACDILLTHNSPAGIHDRRDGVHDGFSGLNDYLTQFKPKYMFHGHQHIQEHTLLGSTHVYGIYGAQILTIDV